MMDSKSSDARALRHPIFWSALVLLVANDHWLKGSDVLAGWLTGKLSDFAGLIVAPLALAALLGLVLRRTGLPPRSTRALAFVGVGGWFAAANLVPPVAHATTGIGAALGLSWTFWADPTDLIALSVLPLAWHVAAQPGAHAAGPRALGEKLAVGLGVAACVASPQPGPPQWTTSAFLVNDTGGQIEVRVRWVESFVDCDAIAPHFDAILSRDTFAPGTRFVLDVGETLPLDRGLADPSSGGTADAGVADPWAPPVPFVSGHRGTCDVAIVSADGLPEVMVFWDGLSVHVIPEIVVDDDDRRAVVDGLHLVTTDRDPLGPLTLTGAAGYELRTPMETYDGGTACRDYGAITGFDWSDFPEWSGNTVRLREVRPTVDGCVSVVIDMDPTTFGETEHSGYICVPPEDFPFLPNSMVQITNDANTLHIIRDLRLDDGTTWRTGELIVRRGVEQLRQAPFDVDLVTVDAACEGVRMDCGGFRVPAAGGLRLGDGVRFVHPGDVVERDAADGRRARLRIGRAETMWVTSPACGAGRDVLGQRLEALVVYGEEPR